MLTLLTGVPGAGKTLYGVYLLLEEMKVSEDNELRFFARLRRRYRISRGLELPPQPERPVFSDIAGLDIPWVEDAPDDWRDTPDGSFIIYDEAHQRESFKSTGKPGLSAFDSVNALNTHRHTGHDLVFITQTPTFLHHQIRGLVGRHIHVTRPAGMKASLLFNWETACLSPNDPKERRRADVVRWRYPKALFKLYKSATVHTHKFRVPRKIAGIIVLASALVCFGVYGVTNLTLFGGADRGGEASASPAPEFVSEGLLLADSSPPSSLLPSNIFENASPRTTVVMGCISSVDRCMCWNDKGIPLDIPDSLCRYRVDAPIPVSLPTSSGASSENPYKDDDSLSDGRPPAAAGSASFGAASGRVR